MTLDQLRRSLAGDAPPQGLTGILKALWLDASGDWKGAHEAAQAETSQDGAWVHAYLHRKEGDLSNADYWYRRAGRDRPAGSLEDEWTVLATHFTDR
jgi:hypothetical protein